MFGPVPAQRAIAVAAVLALHLLLIWLLLQATSIVIAPPAILRELPITLWLMPTEKPKPPKAQEKEKKKEGVQPVPQSLAPPLAPPEGAPPASDYNGLRALGRYMNNCSAGKYEALSPRELAHCLGNQWNGPARGQAALRLGTEPDSVWKSQMDKKKKAVPPIEHQCPLGSKNDQLGLPCFFGN